MIKNLGCYVTKFASHTALNLIARDKLTFDEIDKLTLDERVVLLRVVLQAWPLAIGNALNLSSRDYAVHLRTGCPEREGECVYV